MLSLKVYLKAGDNIILIFKLNYQLLLTYDKNLFKINYLSVLRMQYERGLAIKTNV